MSELNLCKLPARAGGVPSLALGSVRLHLAALRLGGRVGWPAASCAQPQPGWPPLTSSPACACPCSGDAGGADQAAGPGQTRAPRFSFAPPAVGSAKGDPGLHDWHPPPACQLPGWRAQTLLYQRLLVLLLRLPSNFSPDLLVFSPRTAVCTLAVARRLLSSAVSRVSCRAIARRGCWAGCAASARASPACSRGRCAPPRAWESGQVRRGKPRGRGLQRLCDGAICFSS